MLDRKICIVPWTQLEIGPLGDVRPCCEYKGYLGNINETTQTIKEIWNNDEFRKLRREYLDGKEPSGCIKCRQQESASLPSRRQIENKTYTHLFEGVVDEFADNVALLEFKTGNLCNLKCRICTSINSSAWRKEELIVYGFTEDKNKTTNWDQDESRWTQLKSMTNKLEVIYLSGGEPLLIKKNLEFLQHCIDQGTAQNIFLRIITNGTVPISQEMINIFQQFKTVIINFSIDDIGDRFEYQRNPAKWRIVERNFIQALTIDFLQIGIIYTVSIFNVLSADRFYKWCQAIGFPSENVYVNFLRDPNRYDISLLSEDEKDKIKMQLTDNVFDQQILNYLGTTFSEVDKDKISQDRKLSISKIDTLREENFDQLFPELVPIIGSMSYDGFPK